MLDSIIPLNIRSQLKRRLFCNCHIRKDPTESIDLKNCHRGRSSWPSTQPNSRGSPFLRIHISSFKEIEKHVLILRNISIPRKGLELLVELADAIGDFFVSDRDVGIAFDSLENFGRGRWDKLSV
jgi:hypothetical protein